MVIFVEEKHYSQDRLNRPSSACLRRFVLEDEQEQEQELHFGLSVEPWLRLTTLSRFSRLTLSFTRSCLHHSAMKAVSWLRVN